MMTDSSRFFKQDLTFEKNILCTKSIEILGRIADVVENRVFKTDRTKKNLLILGLDRERVN